jgi:pSer/pThr/pTyr-binding forkhead associated (FHA) protein
MKPVLRFEVFQNGELLRAVPFEGTEAWLGRDEDCEIRLDDRAISRKHALVRFTSNGIEFEKKSKFGQARVNGKETDHALLQGGERLEMGSFEIRVIREGAVPVTVAQAPAVEAPGEPTRTAPEVTDPVVEDEAAVADPLEAAGQLDDPFATPEAPAEESMADPFADPVSDSPAAGGKTGGFDFSEVDQDGATRVFKTASASMKPILEFGDGTASMGFYEIVDPEIAIGRSQKCHVVLEDKRSSRKHALIINRQGKFHLKDLGSANGTLLNGERVDEQELHSGDVIRIGDTQFAFKIVQSDYEQKKAEFFQVPQEPEPPPAMVMADSFPAAVAHPLLHSEPAFSGGGLMPGIGMPQSAGAGPEIAEPVAPDFSVPEEEQNPSILGRLIQRYRMMNTRQQILWGGGALAAFYFLVIDEPPPVVSPVDPVAEQKKVQKKTEKKPGEGLTYEMLTKEQKDYVDAQYDLAFEYYKNRDYDKALFELDKIFKIVQNHKGSREIEVYAKEAKRRLEAQEEDRKKKEQEKQARMKLEELLASAGSLMDEGKFKEAEQLFPEIEILEPENAAVAAWQKKIIEEAEKAAKREAEQKRLAEILAKGRADFESAEAAFKQKKYVDALEVMDEIVERPDLDAKFVQKVKDRIKVIEGVVASERDPHLESGKKLEADGKLPEAYREYQAAIAVDPADSEGPAGVKRIQGQLNSLAKSIYSDGVIAEGFGDYEVAEKKYREVIETVPQDNSYHQKAKARLKVFTTLRKAQGGNL